MRAMACLLMLIACSLFAFDAYAYIDPGTGSAVIQAVVAAVLGAGLGLKLFWHRIKMGVAKLFSRGDSDEPAD